jgi:hypothetical protein
VFEQAVADVRQVVERPVPQNQRLAGSHAVKFFFGLGLGARPKNGM